MRFAVAGNPVSHSLSPALFKAAYGYSEHTYGLLEASSAREVIGRFRSEGYDGLNITAPFKESILDFVDVRSELDVSIGAVNTIFIRDGKVHSFNSDYGGVQECIKGYSKHGSHVTVLGCGGAGKAAALAAAGLGCRVTVINRSFEKADAFARRFSMEAGRFDQIPSTITSSDIVINTLPENLDILNNLDFSGKTILEANYKSPQLVFLQNINGINYISGRYWLLYQAVQSFRLFTGVEPDLKSMILLINCI
ncbi:MAG: NAD(P)-dependent oxidoreductase [Rikenellaceae bacterium]|nr:NAD(P)-dependent oxidoreductase [Rikenellaceae bacterium]